MKKLVWSCVRILEISNVQNHAVSSLTKNITAGRSYTPFVFQPKSFTKKYSTMYIRCVQLVQAKEAVATPLLFPGDENIDYNLDPPYQLHETSPAGRSYTRKCKDSALLDPPVMNDKTTSSADTE